MGTSFRSSFLAHLLMLMAPIAAFPQNTVLTTSAPIAGGGTRNVLIGPDNTYSGRFSGVDNIFIGKSSGNSNTTGNSNVSLGSGTGSKNTTGVANSFIGDGAGYENTTGSFNSFTGSQAGASNTSGSDNTFTGSFAGVLNSTGSYNSFTGKFAGYSNRAGHYNSFMGYEAGYNNNGNSNSFLGYQAGYSNITGFSNSFVGYKTGFINETGSHNSFLGSYAGGLNTIGSYNVFTGNRAGFNNTNANYNSFMGYEAGYNTTSGSRNSFVGSYAGYSNNGGVFNTSVGYEAGYNNISGGYNSFFGASSDATGPQKGYLLKATALGYGALVAVNNGVVLGDTLYAKVGIGTAYPNQRFTLRGNMNFVAYDNSLMLKNQPFLHFNERESLALGLGAEIPAGAENTLVLGSDESSVQIPGLLSTYQNSAGQFLTVNHSGKLILTQPRVQVASVADWSDKVFEESYALQPLNEVGEFVKKYKHLPGVPSAAAMVAEGMESTAFNAKLLEKIEELTLYVLELEKKNDLQEERIKVIENKINGRK